MLIWLSCKAHIRPMENERGLLGFKSSQGCWHSSKKWGWRQPPTNNSQDNGAREDCPWKRGRKNYLNKSEGRKWRFNPPEHPRGSIFSLLNRQWNIMYIWINRELLYWFFLHYKFVFRLQTKIVWYLLKQRYKRQFKVCL